MTPDVNDYFPDVDYFLCYDYVNYFGYFSLHVPKTPALPRRSPLSGVEPEDTLFPHVCTQTLTPIYALFSITYHLSSECHIIMSHCIL